MNAYELADKLITGGGDYMMGIGFMLRQQANKIAELEKTVISAQSKQFPVREELHNICAKTKEISSSGNSEPDIAAAWMFNPVE